MSSQIFLSQSALQHNIKSLRARYPQRKAYVCVKSNAYGHGLREIVSMAKSLVDGFCVVSTKEAQKIRPLTSLPVFVLNIVEAEDLSWCAENNVTLPLANTAQLAMYQKVQFPVRVHLEIDTGMVRTGFGWTSVEEMAAFAAELTENIEVEGIYSHFADPDGNAKFTQQQVQRFLPFATAFAEIFGHEPIVHIDKTDSVLEQGSAELSSFSKVWMRLGMGIYGASQMTDRYGLQPVLSWKTSILDLHTIKEGESVGYDRTFFADHDMTIATLPIGYADGFSRLLSNAGEVLISGQRCPVRGLVCMNMTMVEVPPNLRAVLGDEVVLLGQQGPETLTALDQAKLIGTSPYEVVTRLNSNILRSST